MRFEELFCDGKLLDVRASAYFFHLNPLISRFPDEYSERTGDRGRHRLSEQASSTNRRAEGGWFN
jgi:hypothetical protein